MIRILLQAELSDTLKADQGRIRKRLLALFILFNLISCATQEPIPAPIIEQAPVITSQDEKLRQEIAHLKKLLAEKDR